MSMPTETADNNMASAPTSADNSKKTVYLIIMLYIISFI